MTKIFAALELAAEINDYSSEWSVVRDFKGFDRKQRRVLCTAALKSFSLSLINEHLYIFKAKKYIIQRESYPPEIDFAIDCRSYPTVYLVLRPSPTWVTLDAIFIHKPGYTFLLESVQNIAGKLSSPH